VARSTGAGPARRIVVVGGVAGGASAAARARRLDETAEIILLERGPNVSFANCGIPYYVGGEITDRWRLLVATPERFREWFNVDVRTGHEVVSIDPAARTLRVRHAGGEDVLAWDRLVLAPGAAPVVPRIAGVGAPNVFTVRDLRDADRLKAAVERAGVGRAVIVGAGYIGLEFAEMLRHQGLDVTLVERLPQVLRTLDPELSVRVEEELRRQGVDVRTGTTLEGLEAGTGVVHAVRLSDGEVLDTDLVVLALGVKPETRLAADAGLALGPSGGIVVDEFMRTSAPGVYAVGDAVEYTHAVTGQPTLMPLAGPANRAGRVAGEHAATDAAPAMSPVLGTSIVRVFGVVAGATGLGVEAARRAGFAARSLFVAGNHHAGYYPGAEEMWLKVTYDEATRRLLGAQVVGGEGVDKRLDVLATAIRFGARVDDLAALDLAYAPPFGSAKDPLHMVGFVAENEERGLHRTITAEELAHLGNDVQVLDVRSPLEWSAGTLPGAITMSLAELRGRVQELDPARPVVTVCRGGQRAYYATRILSQLGFADVRTLTGGMLSADALARAGAGRATQTTNLMETTR
jgi:NADPH-dependent 2,4-dienoyl-CoA reductase/sulfur reductase-like enzyme/rhodanese-related sulfurtransferase